jgi:hypothetical protein
MLNESKDRVVELDMVFRLTDVDAPIMQNTFLIYVAVLKNQYKIPVCILRHSIFKKIVVK